MRLTSSSLAFYSAFTPPSEPSPTILSAVVTPADTSRPVIISPTLDDNLPAAIAAAETSHATPSPVQTNSTQPTTEDGQVGAMPSPDSTIHDTAKGSSVPSTQRKSTKVAKLRVHPTSLTARCVIMCALTLLSANMYAEISP